MYAELTSEIIFYYPLENILDRLKMYSQYQTRTSDTDEEQFITNDETELLKVECDNAISRIFQVAVKLSKGIVGAVLSDNSLVVGTETKNNVFGFRLVNMHGYNPNVLPIIDQNIQKYWTALVLKTWFQLTRNGDLMAVQDNLLPTLHISYNNSLTELYKPYIASVTPNYSTEEVTVDENNIVTETITTTEMADLVYFETTTDFPETGAVDVTYIDKSTGNQYLWNGTGYIQMNAGVKTFEVEFSDVDTVTVTHNLGKTMPSVSMVDSDGNDWDVDYEAIDEISGIVSWEGNKTGTIYLS